VRITVYIGTGGVGKTSVSAATALAQARSGLKSMVLTTDPALRLRTALRLQEGVLEQRVPLDPDTPGELWAGLLDVKATLDEAVRLYGAPHLVDRILNHPIYATIANSLAGMQELMAVERIDQLRRRGFENLVIDTAPSRHALEFLDKPLFFADLAESHWVRLVGRSYKLVSKTGIGVLGKKTVDLYARVESILGASLVRQVLDFYSIFVKIAEGYAARAQKTVELLKNPSVTEFRVVTTPQKAMRDAAYFTEAMRARNFPIGALYINRVWQPEPGPEPPAGLAGSIVEWYRGVRGAQYAEIARVREEFTGKVERLGELPEMERDVDGLAALERIAVRL
jgi:anion-transporting  ArsA/GET3 family ATPase